MKKQFVMIFCVWIPTAMKLFCFKFENKGNMKRWSLILWCDKRSKLNPPVKWINNGCVPTYTKHGLKLILHEEIKSCVYKKIRKKKRKISWAEMSSTCVVVSHSTEKKNKENGMTKIDSHDTMIHVHILPVSLLTSNTDFSCWKNLQHSTFTTQIVVQLSTL